MSRSRWLVLGGVLLVATSVPLGERVLDRSDPSISGADFASQPDEDSMEEFSRGKRYMPVGPWNVAMIDEKVGPKYGDYARSAAKSIQDAADWVEQKDLVELGEDAKEFVRKSPGLAVGLAAVAGFMLARLFRGGSSD